MDGFKWTGFHDTVKKRYLALSPKDWWGDDLDVRFYLLRQLQAVKHQKILDIGCNIGITLSFLDETNELYGIDIDTERVEKAKKLNPRAQILQASMNELPFEDESFDIVVMMNVVPFYDFPIDASQREQFIADTFREAERVLKKGGKLYLSTPNGDAVHYAGKKITQSYLKESLGAFDFSLKGWNSIGPILPTSVVPLRYAYIPPKLLAKSEYVWEHLVKGMDRNVDKSKYFYVEARRVKHEK